MNEQLKLNVSLLKRSVPNLTVAARKVGLRPATVSNLCTGKIPIARAEVKTLVALADLANCTLDDLIIRGNAFRIIETGIKVLDVFAPLVQGGTIGFVAKAEMGQQILLAEIFHRLKGKGFTFIFFQNYEINYLEESILKYVDHIACSIKEVVDYIWNTDDKEKILLVSERLAIESGDIYDINRNMKELGILPITILFFDFDRNGVGEKDIFGTTDTLWIFDKDLIARSIVPGVNPVQSTSILLEDALLEANHLAIQRRARKFLRRYSELRLLVNNIGLDKILLEDVQHYKIGERLEAYLSQNLYTTESITGMSGEFVSLQDSLESIKVILDEALIR